jgi:hypothetical protein
MKDVAAIVALRRIVKYLRDTDHPDSEWLMTGLAQYEAGAPHRLSLCQALGLRRGQGATAWWQIEAARKRDSLLRAIAARHFDGASHRAAALAIKAAQERYAAGGWRRHLAFISPPAELLGTLRGDLFVLLKLRQPLSFKIIYAALRMCPESDVSGHTDPATLQTDPKESHASREV